MADGSHLPFEENVSYTKFLTCLARAKEMLVEAELGRLSGTEDDLTVEDYEARLTDVKQVHFFAGLGSHALISLMILFHIWSLHFRLKNLLIRQESML